MYALGGTMTMPNPQTITPVSGVQTPGTTQPVTPAGGTPQPMGTSPQPTTGQPAPVAGQPTVAAGDCGCGGMTYGTNSGYGETRRRGLFRRGY
jgi:hypothetical protein